MIVVIVKGWWGAVPHVTSFFYRRLPHINAGLLPWACDWWPADFVSLPELLLDTMSVRDISVRVSVWACQDLFACVGVHVCENVNMCGFHLLVA